MISGLYTLAELQQAIADAPQDWKPLVLTNGCFDLLHVGHTRYLRAAKALGRSLIVGLNSDSSVRQIKLPTRGKVARPIVPELQRAEVLLSLKAVDAVVLFSEATACHLVESLQPDIYVKGGDYSLDTLPEAQIVQQYGGRVELIAIEVPSSTTAIVDRILAAQSLAHS